MRAAREEQARRRLDCERREAEAQANSRWIPHIPTDKQQQFLDCQASEALFGGAAGPGKSEALLMAALRYVDTPGYAAILFRRTYSDLSLPGALMDRARSWLMGTRAKWSEQEHTWRFPSGASLTFGYLETEVHKYRYQSAEFSFVGFDELTQFSETQYLYLFSRLRKLKGFNVPLRMRAASNPGGPGHEWVRTRFIDSESPERVFVRARLSDNPYLDQDEYRKSLANLDPVTREQLLHGDWEVRPSGTTFKREWFTIVEKPPVHARRVRYWDKAGSEGEGDYSAGILMSYAVDGLWYVEDVVRGQWGDLAREKVMRQTAALDSQRVSPGLNGDGLAIWAEQEPGSGGKDSARATVRNLAGYDIHTETVTGSKLVRARPFAAQCEAGNVKLVRGAWNHEYLAELCAFPLGTHDDQVDGSSGAFNKLAGVSVGRRAITVIPGW